MHPTNAHHPISGQRKPEKGRRYQEKAKNLI
jgi:hypothetical protein